MNFDHELIIDPPPSDMKIASVVAYLPAHERRREIVFRKGSIEIHRERVARRAPEVRIEAARVGGEGLLDLRWSARHTEGRPLTYNVVYQPTPNRGFLLARDLTGTEFQARLDHLPGGREARVAVLATDGTRSGLAVSESFAVEEKPLKYASCLLARARCSLQIIP